MKTEEVKSAIKKIEKDNTKTGFNSTSLTSDELKLIKDLNEKINPS